MTSRALGVIGGMGPAATVEFMRRVIEATPARDDSDHVHLIVDNNPHIPSRIAALLDGGGEDPGPALAEIAQRLEAAGADALVIPCNTAHHYLEQVVDAVEIPVLDLIALTLDHVQIEQPGIEEIGLLASTAVLETGLYARACEKRGLSIRFPANQEAVFGLIRQLKADARARKPSPEVEAALAGLVQDGADCVVLACTELCLLETPPDAKVPVYDTVQILAEEVVRIARGGAL
ncbi:MAG: amino acid racemase [Myxococcota bacterium]